MECLECGELKELDEFSVLNTAGVPRPYCKPCNAEVVRLRNYGLTREFADRLFQHQGGRCAICKVVEFARGRTPDVDHDHACCPGRRSCGECVRALVCSKCNAYGLAWYEALPAELRTYGVLNDYLADPPARKLRRELSR
ncbi:hypothetical protein GUY60_36560 [Streptomyces sp. YC537]|uniref:Endonuclease VII n=2 Tax=Streptomyces boluensis TaxID=1775135 RepID=A0A964V1G3_9ACTN|nr:hypothetical protein [Streptomyces boluensis]